MKVKYLLLAGLVSAVTWSCNDDDVATDGGGSGTDTGKAGKAYMEIAVQTSPITKSSTNDDGTTNATPDNEEVGQDFENTIKSALVVAVGEKDGADAVLFAKVTNLISNVDANQTRKIKVEDVALDTDASKKYKIYVYANPTEELVTKSKAYVGTPWSTVQDEIMTLGGLDELNRETLKKNGFLMTNAGVMGDGDSFVGSDGIYTLSTTVKIERAVARFDYKVSGDNANRYFPIVKGSDSESAATAPAATTRLGVALIGYKLMNVSKNYYALRRVATGLNGSQLADVVVGGVETSNNYVVDTDWAQKIGAPENYDAGTHFFVPFNGTSTDGYATLPGAADDKWGSTPSYGFMSYCTENTIVGKENQYKSYTTAVVFKGQLYGKDLESAEAIYVYGDMVFYTLASLKETVTSLTAENPTVQDFLDSGVKRISRSTDGNFYVYYNYWNRHNNNIDPAVMGPMEFAVVRNNVYKLNITSIKELGHPNDPTNPPTTDPDPDPDPEIPSEPDEQEKVYFDISVEVLPWTVRVNDIEF